MTRIIVSGCFGRLGADICRAAAEMKIAAGVDAMPGTAEFPVYTSIKNCTEEADAVICALRPTDDAELLATAEYCEKNRVALVFCTTGQSAEVNAAIENAAKQTAVLRSGNMSLGINLLSGLLAKISPLLHESGFDIEITEKHHNQKIDAPSGTAHLLADSINDSLGGKMRRVYDRSTVHAKRDRDEIGIHALRGGTIVGEHTVTFAGHNEIIEFKHIAQSREVFAVGAIQAAKFLQGKPPGLYSMRDVTEG
ncbi:MAG: 4-hydroxy-tetrahydrodipicolinate reductase [Defluviitaleaceae bacterium]|nr:4-hydroxy-tetrahydrodipicolinate reductase [Defluviitaleaceae bacterium]